MLSFPLFTKLSFEIMLRCILASGTAFDFVSSLINGFLSENSFDFSSVDLKISNHVLGSFGRVSKVRRISDGRILVWKELDYGKMNDKEKQ